jgi:hypothetical protein
MFGGYLTTHDIGNILVKNIRYQSQRFNDSRRCNDYKSTHSLRI